MFVPGKPFQPSLMFRDKHSSLLWKCGKIGILPNGQMHVGLNVNSTISWKLEMMPPIPHLF